MPALSHMPPLTTAAPAASHHPTEAVTGLIRGRSKPAGLKGGGPDAAAGLRERGRRTAAGTAIAARSQSRESSPTARAPTASAS